MPKPLRVHERKPSGLMIRCASASLAAGVLYLLTQTLDCHILPATELQTKATTQSSSTAFMDSFSKIVHCAPFNIMIEPSAEFKVFVDAEGDAKAAISPTVQGDTLHLEVKQGFQTDRPIKVVVGLPGDKLTSVHNKSPESNIVISKGFSVQKFTARNNGNAHMYFSSLDAKEVTLHNNGVGHIVAKANIESLKVRGAGVSKVFVQGHLQAVDIQLTGVSEAHLDSTSDDMVITGNVDMLSKVLYSGGQCHIGQSGPRMTGVGAMAAGGIGAFAGNMHFGNMAGGVGGIFGNSCQQVNNVHIPQLDLKWSCGMEVRGKFTCAGVPSGSSASASTSGNGHSFTSTNGNGAMAMSSSSGGNGMPSQDTFYSTSEGSVRSCACAASAAELNMLP